MLHPTCYGVFGLMLIVHLHHPIHSWLFVCELDVCFYLVKAINVLQTDFQLLHKPIWFKLKRRFILSLSWILKPACVFLHFPVWMKRP